MPTLSWLGDSAARRAARKFSYRIFESIETAGYRTAAITVGMRFSAPPTDTLMVLNSCCS